MGSWSAATAYYDSNGIQRHGGDCNGEIYLFKEGWACNECIAGDEYPSNELSEDPQTPDIPLPIFESLAREWGLDDLEWDTSLPELDAPWPHHAPENLDLRGMVAWLSGRPDVTTYLYDVAELERRLAMDDDLTALMEVVS